MKAFIAKFQIGKSGITGSFIESVDKAIKTHRQIRISALKSSGRNRESIKQMAEEIISKLKTKCVYKTIGFTIILNKK